MCGSVDVATDNALIKLQGRVEFTGRHRNTLRLLFHMNTVLTTNRVRVRIRVIATTVAARISGRKAQNPKTGLHV